MHARNLFTFLRQYFHAIGLGLIAKPVAWRIMPQVQRGRSQALKTQGMFGPIRIYDQIWEDGRPVRVMDVDGSLQSATYTDDGWCDPVFEYYVLYDLMYLCPVDVHNVLMLGGAGYGYPKYLVSTTHTTSITVVEKDPEVTKLARRYFFLNRLEREYHARERGRLRLVTADALDYLRKPGPCYDAILNDCFCAGKADVSLATAEAARWVHERLNPGGAYLTNVVSALEGRRAKPLGDVIDALGMVFAHVYAVSTHRNPPDLNDNIMVVACDAKLDLPFADIDL